MNSTERYRILQNIVAQQGVEADLYAELAKAEQMINMMDQGKMMPPPVPPEINEPMMSQPQAPMSQPMQSPEESEPTMGKYDNL